jgi:Ca-activated chloride channel family protein
MSTFTLPGIQGPVSLLHPHALYLLVPVAAILIWMLLQVDGWRKLFALFMRAMLLVLLVLALAGPERVTTTEGNARPVLIDSSNSITTSMRQWTAGLLRDRLKFRADDPAIMFGLGSSHATVGEIAKLSTSDHECGKCRPEGTDVESALRKYVEAQGESGGPVVMVTDGWENNGDAARAAGSLQAGQVALYVFTHPAPRQLPNVAMSDLTLPHVLPTAEPFKLGVTMLNMNDAPARGTIKLFENDRLIEQRDVTLKSRLERFDFPVRTEGVGLISYRAEFKPADHSQDLYPEDDSLQAWVGIGSRRKVLILSGSNRDAKYLEGIAKRLNLEPEVVDVGSRGYDGNLEGADVVLINNLPRSMLSAGLQKRLVSYAERGGSLAMIGGDQSFGLGGYQGSELEKALPVVSKPPEHKQQRRALVLVIDKSRSMGRENKLQYAKAAAKTATKALKDDDLLSIVGFDAQPFVVVPLQPVRESRPYLDDMIDRLKAGGSTYLMPALKEAEGDLAGSNANIKHVIILTDGETGGTAAMYYDLVSSMHREGAVTISAVAIGREPNIRLLNAISTYGGGGFYHTDNPQNLPEIFLQDMKQHGGEVTMVEKELIPQSQSPDPVLKELAGRRFPAVKGFVTTALKPGATLNMFVERNEKSEPLIASWRYGSGKVLAVTTDANGRWSSEWIREGVFGNVWDKLMTWMAPETATVPKFDVAMGYREGRVELKLTDYSEQGELSSRLMSVLVKRPDKSVEQLMLSENAPGETTTTFEAPKPGTYQLELRSRGGKKQAFPPLAYTVSPAVLAELPRPFPNYDLLEQLASATGGRLNPDPGEIALARPKLHQKTPLGHNLLIAAMLLVVAEAMVRRLTS